MASRSGNGSESMSGTRVRGAVLHDGAGFIAERDAGHVVQAMHALSRQRGQQLAERHLAFAGDDDVGAGAEILADVVSALGAAEYHGPAVQLRGLDDVAARSAAS